MVLRRLSVHVRHVPSRVRVLIAADSALAAVRAATRERHERLDASGWLDRAICTLPAYAAHIADVTSFYAAAERALAPFDAAFAAAGFAPQERRKLPALESERAALASHGLCASAPPVPFPELADFSAAAGCWYVLEGSTLGGMLIARRIAERLGWQSAFYGIYGERTGPLWRAFTQAFTGVDPRLEHAPLAAAARAVFDAYAERVGRLEPLTGR